jgi:hypothetical protein
MDFVVHRPLDQYPGGSHGLAKALGKLAANLQAAPPFRVLGDFRTFIERMLGYLDTAFAAGLLEPRREVFAHPGSLPVGCGESRFQSKRSESSQHSFRWRAVVAD